jgi:hypothetical protein
LREVRAEFLGEGKWGASRYLVYISRPILTGGALGAGSAFFSAKLRTNFAQLRVRLITLLPPEPR